MKAKPVITIYQTGQFPTKEDLQKYANFGTDPCNLENQWWGYFVELTGHRKKAEAKEYALATCKNKHLIGIKGEGVFCPESVGFHENKIYSISAGELSELDTLIAKMHGMMLMFAKGHAEELKAKLVDKTEIGKKAKESTLEKRVGE